MSKKSQYGLKIFESVNVEGNPIPHAIIEAKNVDGTASTSLIEAPCLTDPKLCHKTMIGNRFTGTYDFREIEPDIRAAIGGRSKSAINIATRLGWHDGEYVLPWRTFSAASSPRWLHLRALNLSGQKQKKPRNRALIDLVNKRVRNSDHLLFAVAASFAAPLLELLNEREGFALYFWGDSSSGKTTLLGVANALTKAPNDRELQQFDSTQRGHEELCFEHNDNVLCLDEISAMGERELQNNLAKMVYMMANGHGKRRSHAASVLSELPELSWRTVTLATGELPVYTLPGRDKRSGQDVRFIGVGGFLREQGGIFPGKRPKTAAKWIGELNAACTSYTGDEFETWLSRLVQDRAGIAKKARRLCEKYTEELAGKDADGLTRRRARKFAIIAATGRILAETKIFSWSRGKPIAAVKRLYAESRPDPQQDSKPRLQDEACQYLRTLTTKMVTTRRFVFPDRAPGQFSKNPFGMVRGEGRDSTIAILADAVCEVFDEPDIKKLNRTLCAVPGVVNLPNNRTSINQQLSHRLFGTAERSSFLVLNHMNATRLARSNHKNTGTAIRLKEPK